IVNLVPCPRTTKSCTLFPYTTLFRSRLLRASLSDGEQRPHALLLDPLAVEGGDGETVRVREPLGFRREVRGRAHVPGQDLEVAGDRKSTRLNSSHVAISYAVVCLKKK